MPTWDRRNGNLAVKAAGMVLAATGRTIRRPSHAHQADTGSVRARRRLQRRGGHSAGRQPARRKCGSPARAAAVRGSARLRRPFLPERRSAGARLGAGRTSAPAPPVAAGLGAAAYAGSTSLHRGGLRLGRRRPAFGRAARRRGARSRRPLALGRCGTAGGQRLRVGGIRATPRDRAAFEALAATRPLVCRMSGSGSTLFAVYRSEGDRDDARMRLGRGTASSPRLPLSPSPVT